jgi:hypothetical protein
MKNIIHGKNGTECGLNLCIFPVLAEISAQNQGENGKNTEMLLKLCIIENNYQSFHHGFLAPGAFILAYQKQIEDLEERKV